MVFHIGRTIWKLKFVHPRSEYLRTPSGTYTLGMTDGNANTVYINNHLNGIMLDRVVCHELVHCFSFSYSMDIDERTEEIIADFLATYGRDVFRVADGIFWMVKVKIA